MPSYSPQANVGSFVPTTNNANINQVVNQLSLVLNTKDSGYYALTEFINGQIWFPDPTLKSTSAQQPTLRQVYRLVLNCGALKNTDTTVVAHGLTITAGYTFTRIYGAASDPSTTFIPLPYASPVAAENIALFVDATNVNITTGNDRTGFTTSYVVIEYIKS